MRATFSIHDESITESTLIEAYYDGEESAFAALTERLYPSLKGLALSRIPHSEVGRYQLAEDLVQETLMRVARTKDRGLTRWQPGKSTVLTWVGTILKNLIQKSKYAKHQGFGVGMSGRILLQDHGPGDVKFKNIKIREL